MTLTEIKKEILERVNEVNDNIILEEVYRILQIPIKPEEVFRFSDSQNELLNKREDEIDTGDFVTHEESEKDLDEWLK